MAYDTLAICVTFAGGMASGIVATIGLGILADWRARRAIAARRAASIARDKATAEAARLAKIEKAALAEAAKATAERKARVKPVLQPARGRAVWQGDTWAS